MELTDYLKQLKECPDKQLKDKCGISENWPIFLNADFNSIINYLKNSEKYNHTCEFTEKSKDEIITAKGDPYSKENLSFIDKDLTKHFFNYTPGIVVLQVMNRVPLIFCNGSDEDLFNQKKDYSMMIMLHPYQDMETRKREEHLENRALADAISDLGGFVLKEKIPACMPHTIGYGSKDYSKIVYHLKNKIKIK